MSNIRSLLHSVNLDRDSSVKQMKRLAMAMMTAPKITHDMEKEYSSSYDEYSRHTRNRETIEKEVRKHYDGLTFTNQDLPLQSMYARLDNKGVVGFSSDNTQNKNTNGRSKSKPSTPEKIATRVTNSDSEEQHTITAMIKRFFPFTNNDECVSAKRSLPTYMSKQDIVKQINNNKSLKTLAPKNYRTLSKEKLCEFLQSLKT